MTVYRDPEPSKQALEIKTPPLVKRPWLRPICWLKGHHWHWTRWNPTQWKDYNRWGKFKEQGADKFCRRCGAESYDCDITYGFQRIPAHAPSEIVRTIKP